MQVRLATCKGRMCAACCVCTVHVHATDMLASKYHCNRHVRLAVSDASHALLVLHCRGPIQGAAGDYLTDVEGTGQGTTCWPDHTRTAASTCVTGSSGTPPALVRCAWPAQTTCNMSIMEAMQQCNVQPEQDDRWTQMSTDIRHYKLLPQTAACMGARASRATRPWHEKESSRARATK